jgi:hypothetical protein
VAPIPIKKQTTDLNAVMNCIRVAREGGTIAIAPEGNRTFSGETVYMSDSIAPLAKKLKLPIALYRIEGGYGVQPRWSDVVRRGKMRGYVSQVIEPEEYADMKPQELFRRIAQGLYVDEAVADGVFLHGKRAEYRAVIFVPRHVFPPFSVQISRSSSFSLSFILSRRRKTSRTPKNASIIVASSATNTAPITKSTIAVPLLRRVLTHFAPIRSIRGVSTNTML